MHSETETAFPWVGLLIAAAVFLMFLVVVAVIARGRRRRLVEQAGQPQTLEGFGGWLALLVLGQTLAPLRLAAQFVQTWATYETVTEVENGPAIFYGEAVVNTALILFSLLVTVWMWRKKRAFPTLFTWEWAILLVVPILDLVVVAVVFGLPIGKLMDRDFLVSEARSIVAVAWVFYVHRSARVRATFVR